MQYRFAQHYTREEAEGLLPTIRQWLEELRRFRGQLTTLDQRMAQLLSGGNDVGGETVNAWIRNLAGVRAVLRRFQRREILLKDLDRGLVDFPAVIGGREVFLCWEEGETAVEFWHDLDAGYAGRERLS